MSKNIKQQVKDTLFSISRRIFKLFLMPFALLGVIIVRILRPFVLIRFGELYSSRIGHFTINTELYLCERDIMQENRKIYDIFYHTLPICNYQLKKMWDRTLHVSRFLHLMRLTDSLNRLLPGYEKHIVPLEHSRDLDSYYERISPHLSFSAKEEECGMRALKDMGVCEKAPFVCFHVRDSAYLSTALPVYKWDYHSYRDARVQNYILAAEELARRGYFVIRMGSVIKEPLVSANPMIIDYARNYRTDFLDIYLSAKCKFFIGSASGIDEVPKVFRRPVVYVNFIPLGVIEALTFIPLFIPKKLWLREEGRFLTFKEILDSGAGRYLFSEEYERGGLDVIDNTPEEITDVVIEMDERLKGTWKITEEDEELQRCFWSFFKPSELRIKISCRIGTKFLRQNQELLFSKVRKNENIVSYT
jgi:putative glycosyltransferase (TIGR04372 family)